MTLNGQIPKKDKIVTKNHKEFKTLTLTYDFLNDIINTRQQSSELLKGGMKMKSTGIVRKVDELGRIVLPIELRRTLDIAEKDSLEIFVDDDKIVLKKYEPTCVFCGNSKDVVSFKGKNICPACLSELK